MKNLPTAEELKKELAAYEASVDRRRETAHERGEEPHMGLSAWGESVMLGELRLKIEVAERGWTWDLPVLMKGDEIVPARLRDGQYGLYWMLIDENGRPTGKFFNDSRGPRSKLSKAGYRVEMRSMPAKVIRAGANMCSVRAFVVRDYDRETA